MIDPPETYYWQLSDADGVDCTGTPIYAENDAREALLWREDGDLLIVLNRQSRTARWHQESTGTGGIPIDRTFHDLDEALRALALIP